MEMAVTTNNANEKGHSDVDASQLNEIEMILPTYNDSDSEGEHNMSITTDPISIEIGSEYAENTEKEEEPEEEYTDDIEEKTLVLQIPKLSPSAVSSTLLSKYAGSSLMKHYACDLCGRHASSLGKLEKHMKNAHMPPDFQYLCHFCDKKFVHYWFYKNHLKSNHNGVEMVFSCQICSNVFHSEKQLEDHKMMEHAARVFAYKCRHCDIAFKDIESLRSHLMEFHVDSKEAASAKYNIEFLKQEASLPDCPDLQFPCRYCKKRFKDSTECDVHIIYEHRGATACNMCKKSNFPTEEALLKHLKEFQHDLTRCTFCTMKFKSMSALVQHWEDQHSEIGRHSFYCEMCGVRFVTFTRLTNHYLCHTAAGLVVPEKKEVSAPKPVHVAKKKEIPKTNGQKNCAFCDATFSVKTNLYNHIRKLHPDSAHLFLPFRCDKCQKNFPSESGLAAHARVHQFLPTASEIYFMTPRK